MVNKLSYSNNYPQNNKVGPQRVQMCVLHVQSARGTCTIKNSNMLSNPHGAAEDDFSSLCLVAKNLEAAASNFMFCIPVAHQSHTNPRSPSLAQKNDLRPTNVLRM